MPAPVWTAFSLLFMDSDKRDLGIQFN